MNEMPGLKKQLDEICTKICEDYLGDALKNGRKIIERQNAEKGKKDSPQKN